MKTKHRLLLQRTYGAQGTNGKITYRGTYICYSIELPWCNNLPRLSCIPTGTYKLKRCSDTAYGEQIGVANVLRREAILIRAATDARGELLGGIGTVSKLTGQGMGAESEEALSKLKALVYCLWDMGDEVYLTIK